MTRATEAILLVGHGATASDTPRNLVEEFKRLEGERMRGKNPVPSPREKEVDRQLRQWQRTPATDPYKAGLELLGSALEKRLPGVRLALAYNEFCSPSVEEAIDTLVKEGVQRVTLLSTMFTPGGVHSEIEIPDIVRRAKTLHPRLDIVFAWPFDLQPVAQMLLDHWKRFASPETPVNPRSRS